MSAHPPTQPVLPHNPFAPPPQAPPPGPIDHDVACITCGYNLRGLHSSGVCPECGTPAENALRGNLLLYTGQEYFNALRRGLSLILNFTLLVVLTAIIGIVLAYARIGSTWTGPALEIAVFVLNTIILFGWWLFSSPDPAYAGVMTGDKPRAIVRVATIAMAALSLVDIGVTLLAPTVAGGAANAVGGPMVLRGGIMLLSLGAAAAQFFAAMLYIRWLAPRLPNRIVYDRAKRNMWLLPILQTVGILLFGLGPLIALVIYWNHLDLIRKDLRRIAAERAAPPSGTVAR